MRPSLVPVRAAQSAARIHCFPNISSLCGSSSVVTDRSLTKSQGLGYLQVGLWLSIAFSTNAPLPTTYTTAFDGPCMLLSKWCLPSGRASKYCLFAAQTIVFSNSKDTRESRLTGCHWGDPQIVHRNAMSSISTRCRYKGQGLCSEGHPDTGLACGRRSWLINAVVASMF